MREQSRWLWKKYYIKGLLKIRSRLRGILIYRIELENVAPSKYVTELLNIINILLAQQEPDKYINRMYKDTKKVDKNLKP